MQTFFQFILAFGIVLTAIGGFGAYYFSKLADDEQQQKSTTIGTLVQNGTVGKSAKGPRLILGDSDTGFIYTGLKTEPAIDFAGTPIYLHVENGKINCSIPVKDATGKLIAEIIDNEWRVSPAAGWDRNYDSHAVEVRDASGAIVLQVDMTDRGVRLKGRFPFGDGGFCAVGDVETDDASTAGRFLFNGRLPDDADLFRGIKPIFKYPSELHLGERVGKTGQNDL